MFSDYVSININAYYLPIGNFYEHCDGHDSVFGELSYAVLDVAVVETVTLE
jgi:hypothetical protein